MPWVRVTYVKRNANAQWYRCASDGRLSVPAPKMKKQKQKGTEQGPKKGGGDLPKMARRQCGQKMDGRESERTGGREGKRPNRNTKGATQTEGAARAGAAQDGQARTSQTNAEYGRSRSNLDQTLKEAIEGDTLSSGESKFHTLGAMDFIDLLSE